ncbi:hypothetical protein CCP2SC5_1320008 [Azospirillaceae bacterium]
MSWVFPGFAVFSVRMTALVGGFYQGNSLVFRRLNNLIFLTQSNVARRQNSGDLIEALVG